LLAEASDVDEG